MLRNLIPVVAALLRRQAAVSVSELPAYQVALWPDGWDLGADGSVLVLDTHAMAEARRWYSLADRNRSREDGRRVMSLHGIFVPRAIIDLANRRFPSEHVASVAVQLIASDWIAQRRRQLLEAPDSALREHFLSWCGSRHEPGMEAECVAALIRELVGTCVEERLIPDADYRVRVRPGNRFGIVSHRCELDVCLDPHAAAEVLELLGAALIPWNRAVVRDGSAARLIELGLSPRHRFGP